MGMVWIFSGTTHYLKGLLRENMVLFKKKNFFGRLF